MTQRQTRKTPQVYGLLDCGLIAPGLRADINLIDFEVLSLNMPEMVYDFPANGRHLVEHTKGYVGTWGNDVQIVSSDEFTGELPGQLFRH